MNNGGPSSVSYIFDMYDDARDDYVVLEIITNIFHINAHRHSQMTNLCVSSWIFNGSSIVMP